MTIAILSHPDCLLHDMGAGHPEQPARIKIIEQTLKNADLNQYFKFEEAPLASLEQLTRVHPLDYVNHLFQISPKTNTIALDPDTLMNPFTLNAALRAAGASVRAVDLVMTEHYEAAFCNVRPPGHHAERAKAMGFCFFNNVAIGVAHALAIYQLKRVAIVDFDVHHGNGTEDIFQNHPEVLLCSSFQHPFYPFSHLESASSNILKLPLRAGTKGDEFRQKVAKNWLEKLKEFSPEIIFFSAGFDAHEADPLANLCLNESDFLWISEKIRDIANQCCKGKIVSSLEGGYQLEHLGKSVLAHLRGLVTV